MGRTFTGLAPPKRLILCLLFLLLVTGLPLSLVVMRKAGSLKIVPLPSVLVTMYSVFLPVKLKGKAQGYGRAKLQFPRRDLVGGYPDDTGAI